MIGTSLVFVIVRVLSRLQGYVLNTSLKSHETYKHCNMTQMPWLFSTLLEKSQNRNSLIDSDRQTDRQSQRYRKTDREKNIHRHTQTHRQTG